MATITAHHYVLAVPDAQRTAEFFVRGLGFTPTPVADTGWRFVTKDGLMIMLGSCPDAIPPRELGDHSYFGYLVVDDVDGYFQQVKAYGVDLLNVPADKPWNMREFGIRTPDGHRLMIGQPISKRSPV